jgi:aminoglycoside phosphotransferase
MPDPDFAHLAAQQTLGDDPIPEVVLEHAKGDPVELAWRNELGGLTFRIGDHFVKWNPRRNGIDLELERVRLQWLEGRHPAPRIVEAGADHDAQWLVTEALPGACAVGDTSMSLDWNFGEGHQDELFELYGIAPDEERIRYYRALWHLES